jgi:hypothetical protein
MEDLDGQYRRLLEAVSKTQVVKAPNQHLHTFGVTRLQYFIVTEPIYSEVSPGPVEAVIRQGVVTAARPKVVTPSYMAQLDGFGDDAKAYFNSLALRHGSNTPGLLYHYKNEPGEMEIVEGAAMDVAQRVSHRLKGESNNLSVVMLGVDELWDVSLLKFIFEYTAASVSGNVEDLQARRLFDPAPEVDAPRAAVQHIEELFTEVERGADLVVLKRELDHWGLFPHYQDRFFSLFRRKGA